MDHCACSEVYWDELLLQDDFLELQRKAPVGEKLGDYVMRLVYDLLSSRDVGVLTDFYGLKQAPKNSKSVILQSNIMLIDYTM